jgi:hypothetical protein
MLPARESGWFPVPFPALAGSEVLGALLGRFPGLAVDFPGMVADDLGGKPPIESWGR